jgi:hypothetical protein
VRWVGYRGRALPHPRFADHFAPPELVASQVYLDPRRKAIPHVPLDALSVEIHVGPEQITADQILNDQGCDVAVTPARVLRRPSIIFFGSIETPCIANSLFYPREGQHTVERNQSRICGLSEHSWRLKRGMNRDSSADERVARGRRTTVRYRRVDGANESWDDRGDLPISRRRGDGMAERREGSASSASASRSACVNSILAITGG